MDHAATTAQLVADLLRAAGHPDVTAVTVLDPPTVHLGLADGSSNYVKVAHVQRADRPAPERPSWPGYPQAAGR